MSFPRKWESILIKEIDSRFLGNDIWLRFPSGFFKKPHHPSHLAGEQHTRGSGGEGDKQELPMVQFLKLQTICRI
ncbi:MAG: hypothetical protein CO189_10900 [candidate division Zixibacteria bacterium CG_4_9_14_3_um_filter_46_8]|nr:MAG: hypothetical protein CO189_10900 [candidate division Zixibacteria bacterium CG_4_9_14_3_um_filter_46_8]